MSTEREKGTGLMPDEVTVTVTLSRERFDAVRWAISMGITLRNNMPIQEALIEASNDFGRALDLASHPTPDGERCPTCAGTHDSAGEFCSDAFHGPASPPEDLRGFCEQQIGEVDAERRDADDVTASFLADGEIHAYQEVLRKLESGPASPVLGDEERERLLMLASAIEVNDFPKGAAFLRKLAQGEERDG